MRFSLLMLLLLCASGCYNRAVDSTFKPIPVEGPYLLFEYTVQASGYSADPTHAMEQQRLKWLREWLDLNGCQGKEYQILSRECIRMTGDFPPVPVYNIIYRVRVAETP